MKKLGRFVFPVALALTLGLTQSASPAFAGDAACGGAQAVPAGPKDYTSWSENRSESRTEACGVAEALPTGPKDYTYFFETRTEHERD